ncbi:MAG: hypothetical protein ABFQ65_02275 [Nanoarchaeota archaeon]
MVVKKFFMFGIFSVISILLISNIFAFSCSVVDTPIKGAESVVMAFSSSSNAHGEVRDGGGNYPWFVSCDFEGTNICNGENGILSLSSQTNASQTNAHAELLDTGNYDVDVCFGNVDCRSGSGLVCLEDEFGVVSFSDSTNAHLGGFDDYDFKVCCKWQANAYWADADDISVEKSLVAVGDRVKLVLNNSGLKLGNYQGFQIFENDATVDDDILPRTDGAIIIGDVILSSEINSFLSGLWEVTQADYDAGKDCVLGIGDCSPDEFYFIVNGVQSPYLNIVVRDEGASFCSDFTEEDICTSCSNHIDCPQAYNSANDLSKETFDVGCGETLLDDDHYNTNCFCQWNSGECGPGVSVISVIIPTIATHCRNDIKNEDLGETGVDCGGLDCSDCGAPEHCFNDLQDEDLGEDGIDCGGDDCGSCSSSISFPSIGSWEYFSEDEDDCADGFLEYSWTSEWTWGVNNGFVSIDNDFSDDPLDYVTGDDGLFYYDPQRLSEKSSEGHQIIPCPAQIQLPFFGFFGVVASLVLIALIYLSLIFKNKDNF